MISFQCLVKAKDTHLNKSLLLWDTEFLSKVCSVALKSPYPYEIFKLANRLFQAKDYNFEPQILIKRAAISLSSHSPRVMASKKKQKVSIECKKLPSTVSKSGTNQPDPSQPSFSGTTQVESTNSRTNQSDTNHQSHPTSNNSPFDYESLQESMVTPNPPTLGAPDLPNPSNEYLSHVNASDSENDDNYHPTNEKNRTPIESEEEGSGPINSNREVCPESDEQSDENSEASSDGWNFSASDDSNANEPSSRQITGFLGERESLFTTPPRAPNHRSTTREVSVHLIFDILMCMIADLIL